jgi:UDP-GlcNAc:undecaprenyl-phosphate GlcNAc-1-phosphate transferase
VSWFILGLTFILSLLLALYGVPMARQAALRFNVVDKPDGRLKLQEAPVPYMGGLAVYLAFLISLALAFEFRQDVLGLVLAGTLVVLVGLIDDFGVLEPWPKLAGQLIAVFVLIRSGIRIEIAALPDWLDVALTVFWMIGIINAMNIIDVMDGLAGGVGVVACLWLFVVAILNQDMTIAVMVAALAGSLIGFLRFNFHPAKIYLGDSGSLFIGLMLGALAMIGKYTKVNPVSLLVPVFVLGVPIFDTFFVMYIRRLRGIPMFLGSPDHFALRLRRWALSVPQVAIVSYAVAFLLGAVGVGLMFVRTDIALVMVAATAVALIATALWLQRIDMSKPAAQPASAAKAP